MGDLTILSGANDVGKSNLLKALNLFFNNEVDWLAPIDFYRDFSLRRLDEVRRESIKGKQFIRIDVDFRRPSSYSGSLPPTFTVTKWWFRDSVIPQEDNNLENQADKLPSTLETARRMLSKFLNRVHFEYVPAIRDRKYYEYVLENLQETLITTQMESDDPILNAVRILNTKIEERAKSLQSDFEKATTIEANVSLPTDPRSLFRAFSVSTKWQNEAMKDAEEEQEVLLALRGDGIQACYVPALLNYIAKNSAEFYLWGFEEPENSVEYNLAIDLADRFNKVYSKNAQIFITSHSPAFVSLQDSEVVSYRVYKEEDSTEVAQLYPSQDEESLHQLSEDIGLFSIQKELHFKYLRTREKTLEAQREAEYLRDELSRSLIPVIYVEGKTDANILNVAWNKLFPEDEMPFDIKHCDPLPEDRDGGSGGANTLKTFLSTVRADSSRLAIGIFDRDVEGCKEYKKLPAYFEEISELETKVSKNQKAAGFLLPVPVGKEAYAYFQNLYIEFYFSEQVLNLKNDQGHGISFKQPKIEQRIAAHGNQILSAETSSLLETRKIVDGKTVFAQQIVPTLDTEEFEHFAIVFEMVQEILDFLQ
ncbi:MAG: ATP-binding protein [Chloroflexi bacterium]|nr:ATP-binding protein [Chloroflexota bacterium]